MKKGKIKKKRIKGEILERIPMLKTLNSQQNAAKGKIRKFLKSDDKFFLLSGGAGTGKTHTVGALVAHLQDENERLWIAATAPTNKAVKVLKNSTLKWGNHNLDYGTIYHFLGLTIDYNEEGERVLIEGKRSTIDKYDLIIIDESSMISTNLWNLLNKVAYREENTKFLLIGDNAQLNPVNEQCSPIFTDINSSYELTKVMRTQDNNPVMDIITSARTKVFNTNYRYQINSNFSSDKMNGVWIMDQQDWLKQMINAFKSPKYKDNPDYVKAITKWRARAIAWRNKTVDSINSHVRNAIFSEKNINLKPYVVGERLIAKDAIFDYSDPDEILLSNSDEFEVIEINKDISKDGYYIYWLEVISFNDGEKYRLPVIQECSQAQYNNDLKREANNAHAGVLLKEKNSWKPYWKLRNRYARVDYAYAVTSHKSQGSTFDNVFVAKNDICRNQNLPERYRSLYVSYSRTKSRLLVTA
jgi:exodeoxyribonuclease-5